MASEYGRQVGFEISTDWELPVHGSPEDRGSADRYYHRGYSPHWYPNGTGNGKRVKEEDMTPEQIALYKKGWDEEQERKIWE